MLQKVFPFFSSPKGTEKAAKDAPASAIEHGKTMPSTRSDDRRIENTNVRREDAKIQKNLVDENAALVLALKEKTESLAVQTYNFQQNLIQQQEQHTAEKQKYAEYYQGEVERLSEDLKSIYSQLTRTKELLADRTAELQTSQKFLTSDDTYSGAEVIKMVSSLNAEIYQISAYIADAFYLNGPSESRPIPISAPSQNVVLSRLSELISQTTSPDSPDVAQIALQTALVDFCAGVMSGWTYDPAVNSFMKSVEYYIRQRESPLVSRRWRAMTRAATQASVANSNTFPDVDLYILSQHIFDVLRIMGGFSPNPSLEGIKLKFGANLSAITKLTQQLSCAIWEGVTSMDMEVTVVQAGKNYDSQTMDLLDGDGSEVVQNDTVLFTIDLGLSMRNNEGVHLLMKPKVMLRSMMLNM